MVYSQPRPARSPLICGACRECCKGPRELELFEPSFMWHTEARGGKTFLATRDNGDCVYLCSGGCSIYETRPNACRDFDCRDYVTHPGMSRRIRLQAARRITMDTTVHNPCNPAKPKKRKKKKRSANPPAVGR